MRPVRRIQTIPQLLWLTLSAMPCNISGYRRNGVMMPTGSGNTTVEF